MLQVWNPFCPISLFALRESNSSATTQRKGFTWGPNCCVSYPFYCCISTALRYSNTYNLPSRERALGIYDVLFHGLFCSYSPFFCHRYPVTLSPNLMTLIIRQQVSRRSTEEGYSLAGASFLVKLQLCRHAFPHTGVRLREGTETD